MFFFMYMLEMAPLEMLGVVLYLSYNYPNSIFRQIFVKFGKLLVFLVALIMFGMFWGDMQFYLPDGIPVDSKSGVYSEVLSLGTNDSYSDNKIIDGRNYGYDIDLYIVNNTKYPINYIIVDIEIFECENKPNQYSGPYEPKNCVSNGRTDTFNLSENYILNGNDRVNISSKSYISSHNYSSGKYPYIFVKSNITAKKYIPPMDNRLEYEK